MRRTKIIATLGPATDKPGVLERLLDTGVDLFRINYSHQDAETHARRMHQIRELCAARNEEAGVIADLQGPKIRLERFAGEKVFLEEGQTFTLDTGQQPQPGDIRHVGVSYKNLARDVKPGSRLLVDDGRIVL
jgi:pyruvate kinase